MIGRATALTLVTILFAGAWVPAAGQLGLVPGADEALDPVTAEVLRNGGVEGAAAASNGFRLYYNGSETVSSPVHEGAQAVNLAKGGVTATAWSALGNVATYPFDGVPFATLRSFQYWYNVPNDLPSGMILQNFIRLDVDGDGAPDACLLHSDTVENTAANNGLGEAPLQKTDGWQKRTFDGSSLYFPGVDAGPLGPCPGGPDAVPLSTLQADPAFAAATVLRLHIQVTYPSNSPPYPADAPVYVDGISMQATEVPSSASIGYHAEFRFEPPLHPSIGDTITHIEGGGTSVIGDHVDPDSLTGPDGTPDPHGQLVAFQSDGLGAAEHIIVMATFYDQVGAPKPFHGVTPRLVLAAEQQEEPTQRTYAPEWSGGPQQNEARFKVPVGDLVLPGQAEVFWHAQVTQDGLVEALDPFSFYNWHAQQVFPEAWGPPIADALDAQATWIKVIDTDLDTVPDGIDNCPEVANTDQADMDLDDVGDVCDTERDGDGYNNTHETDVGSDPDDPASTPVDLDGDGFENGVEEAAGSDPRDADSTPDDLDGDGFSNTLEESHGSDPRDAASIPTDVDGDGVSNASDNCPTTANAGQADADGDGAGDACDPDPTAADDDLDDDGIINPDDNCPHVVNAGQGDLDGDGIGDACDDDRDGDGVLNGRDAFPDDSGEAVDTDGDGVGDAADTDDDNDGLSDAKEDAIGTDARKVDSDGDALTDKQEHDGGSDPTDALSPDYRIQDVAVRADDTGAIHVSWQTPADPRIDSFLVWRHSEPELVTQVAYVGGQPLYGAVDQADALPGGSHRYSVQTVLSHAKTTLFDGQVATARSEAVTYLPAEEPPEETAEQDTEDADDAENSEAEAVEETSGEEADDEEAGAPLFLAAVAVLGATLLVRRRR